MRRIDSHIITRTLIMKVGGFVDLDENRKAICIYVCLYIYMVCASMDKCTKDLIVKEQVKTIHVRLDICNPSTVRSAQLSILYIY